MAGRKSWREKLDNGREPKVVRVEKAYAGIPAGTRVLVSTPREVNALIRRLPEGRFVGIEEIRRRLAKKHGAETACPLATGIFLRIVSEAAWEEIQEGREVSEVTPFWRVVPRGSALAGKLACGVAFVGKMQRGEGIGA